MSRLQHDDTGRKQPSHPGHPSQAATRPTQHPSHPAANSASESWIEVFKHLKLAAKTPADGEDIIYFERAIEKAILAILLKSTFGFD